MASPQWRDGQPQCPLLQLVAPASTAAGTVQGRQPSVVGSMLYYDVSGHGLVPRTHIRPDLPRKGDPVTVQLAQTVTVLDPEQGVVRTENGIRQSVCPQGLRAVNGEIHRNQAAQAYLAMDTWGLDNQLLEGGSGGMYTLQKTEDGSPLDSILRTYNLPASDMWVRIINATGADPEDNKRIERLVEGLALQAAEPREPHFATALAVCFDPVPFALLKRYPHGSLLDKVSHHHDEVLARWPAIWTQLQEIGETLQRRNIIHHNIKLDNLLIKSWDPVELKLADFDQAVVLEPSVEHVTYDGQGSGTWIDPLPSVSPQYGATHMLRGGSWPVTAADMWSLGMVGFATYTGTFAAKPGTVPSREELHAAKVRLQTAADYEPLARYLERLQPG